MGQHQEEEVVVPEKPKVEPIPVSKRIPEYQKKWYGQQSENVNKFFQLHSQGKVPLYVCKYPGYYQIPTAFHPPSRTPAPPTMPGAGHQPPHNIPYQQHQQYGYQTGGPGYKVGGLLPG